MLVATQHVAFGRVSEYLINWWAGGNGGAFRPPSCDRSASAPPSSDAPLPEGVGCLPGGFAAAAPLRALSFRPDQRVAQREARGAARKRVSVAAAQHAAQASFLHMERRFVVRVR